MINKIIEVGIWLLPFTSLPWLNTDYRPISLLMFFAAGLVISLRKLFIKSGFSIDELITIAILIFTLLVSIANQLSSENSMISLFIGMVPLLIGVLTYISFKYYLNEDKNQIKFKRIIKYLSIFIIVFGAIELLSMVGVLPFAIKDFISYMSNNMVANRLILTTQEPSWAARLLIFLLGFAIIHKTPIIILPLIIFLLFLTFSIDGYLILIISLIVFFLIKLPLKKTAIGLISILFVWVILNQSNTLNYLINNNYTFKRINSILANVNNFSSITKIDGSIYLRTNYPIISLKVLNDNFLHGVGVDNYSQYAIPYIEKRMGLDNYFPLEIKDDIQKNEVHAGFMISKLFIEGGLVVTTLFILLILFTINTIYNNRSKSLRSKLLFLNILLFVSTINFQSYAYLYFWIGLAYTNSQK